MIQYDKDGASFIDPTTGRRVTVFEQPAHQDLQDILDLQMNAVTANKDAADYYNTAIKGLQVSVDAGRADQIPPAPTKPLMRVVSDTGSVTYTPFVPPLPDLVIPTAPHTPTAIEAIEAARAATVDKQAVMYAMITAIYRKMFPSN
jgi:hypothetical protein